MLSFSIGLEKARSKQQGQVLGAHLVQISTLLDPGAERRTENIMDLPAAYHLLPLMQLTLYKEIMHLSQVEKKHEKSDLLG